MEDNKNCCEECKVAYFWIPCCGQVLPEHLQFFVEVYEKEIAEATTLYEAEALKGFSYTPFLRLENQRRLWQILNDQIKDLYHGFLNEYYNTHIDIAEEIQKVESTIQKQLNEMH